ncbi:Photosystem I chlorophyll a apoprotein A1 [Capsicum chinense]|nr:Photosystem I chlorophyll a apoprotein A1 [Capsicum chinense]
MFSDTAIQLQSIFAQCIQNIYALAPGETTPGGSWNRQFLGTSYSCIYDSCEGIDTLESWKMQSDVWGSVSDQGVVTHITGGNFAQSSITINGWLRDFLWAQASQVIQSYGSSLSAYGL